MANGKAGYSGPSFVAMVDELERTTHEAGWKLAEAMVERGEHNIQINTPVETSHLRDSYKKTGIKYGQQATLGYTSIRWALYAWTGSVYTEVEYAPFVELGTGLWGPKRRKYKIAPKKPGGVLAFTPYQRTAGGGVILDIQGNPSRSGTVVVRFVMHPGSPGQHMFKIGTILTEREMAEWSAEPMRLWKTQVETRIARAKKL